MMYLYKLETDDDHFHLHKILCTPNYTVWNSKRNKLLIFKTVGMTFPKWTHRMMAIKIKLRVHTKIINNQKTTAIQICAEISLS